MSPIVDPDNDRAVTPNERQTLARANPSRPRECDYWMSLVPSGSARVPDCAVGCTSTSQCVAALSACAGKREAFGDATSAPAGSLSLLGSVVRRVCSLSVGFIMYISKPPVRSEAKTTHWPSGDQPAQCRVAGLLVRLVSSVPVGAHLPNVVVSLPDGAIDDPLTIGETRRARHETPADR